jgi:hypothetical protein
MNITIEERGDKSQREMKLCIDGAPVPDTNVLGIPPEGRVVLLFRTAAIGPIVHVPLADLPASVENWVVDVAFAPVPYADSATIIPSWSRIDFFLSFNTETWK